MWVKIITAAIAAYQDREKAKENKELALQIIRDITQYVKGFAEEIVKKLEALDLNEIKGIYTGLLLNFDEYEPNEEHKEWLEKIIYDSNIIRGRLITKYETSSDLLTVNEIVDLLSLVTSLRSMALAERKFTFGINKDEHVLEMFNYLLETYDWLINKSVIYRKEVKEKWESCMEVPPQPGLLCLPVDDPIDLPDLPLADCRCSPERIEYKRAIKYNQILMEKRTAVLNAISEIENGSDLYRNSSIR